MKDRMKYIVLGVALAALCAGCSDDTKEETGVGCTPEQFKDACEDAHTRLVCEDGLVKRMTCANGEQCQNGACVSAQACVTGTAICDGNYVSTCVNGMYQKAAEPCEAGCTNGQCVGSEHCGNGTLDAGEMCDGANLGTLTCEDAEGATRGAIYSGVPVCKSDCSGVEMGTCALNLCGNGTLDAGEKCDGANLGQMTCADVPNASDAYHGVPVCKSDCSGVEMGTCSADLCGNNVLDIVDYDIENSEFCDTVDGVASFYDFNTPTCDVLNAKNCGEPGMPTCYQYEDGGVPGCSKDCKGYSKGTCRIKAQPMDGLQTCEFSELQYDEEAKTLTAKARVTTDAGLSAESITAYMYCGHLETPTYSWSIKSDSARFLECEDCAADEYAMIADISTAKTGAGDYDCVFRVHVNHGQSSSSFYLCPTRYGYPSYENEATTKDYTREFSIEGTPVEGTVLAHWGFSAFKKDDYVNQVAADDGIFAATSTMKLSDDGKIRMLTGVGGYPEAAASMTPIAHTNTCSLENDRHFQFNTSTTGYTNIRVQYKVTGTGIYDKHIRTVAKIQDVLNQVGTDFVFDTAKEFEDFPQTTVVNGENLSALQIRVYPWVGVAEDNNATVRVDEFYVLGDKIVTPPATPTP